MSTMRAVTLSQAGGPEVLEVSEVELPVRANAELLVRVVAAGVNPIDLKTRAGRGVSAALRFPAVLGFDFAGVVEETSHAAHPMQPGDRVHGMARVPRGGGSYAELVAATSLSVTPMPTSLDFVQAAAVPLAALTAWGAVVDTARVHDGQRVLIHAGAGGVGHFAVQLAAYFGATVTATGSPCNADFLRGLGADRVIHYASERFEDVAGEQDVVIDLIGNVHDDTGTRSLDVLRRGGLIVNIPTASWPTMQAEAEARGIRATGYSVVPDARSLTVIGRLIDDGAVRVHVERELPLEQGAEAHRLLEAGHVRGKVVLRVSPDPVSVAE